MISLMATLFLTIQEPVPVHHKGNPGLWILTAVIFVALIIGGYLLVRRPFARSDRQESAATDAQDGSGRAQADGDAP